MKTIVLNILLLFALTTKAQQRGFTPSNAKGETEKRLALVIGNANYQGNSLTNPLNDAKAMRTALQELGFTVQYYENLNKTAMEAALMRFSTDLHKHNVGLFYFAGHGFESKDKVNYLMSTDMNTSVNEALAKDKSLNLDVVMQSMQDANANSNLLVIDACRNNPFRSWSRDGAKGLGSVSPALGTVVFFAASAGQAADDNRVGNNGLFTEEFLLQIRKPNLELTDILKNTSRAVYKRSGGQMPAISGNLLEDFYFSKISKSNSQNELKENAKSSSDEKETKSTTMSDSDMFKNGNDAWQAGRYSEAKGWYESAANANNKDAMNSVGMIYEQGKGAVRNINTAKVWYEAAHILGSISAEENLNRIKNEEIEQKNIGKELYFKRLIHDFGEINEGTKAIYSFDFVNLTAQTLTIQNVVTSCNCVVVDWPRSIPSGENGSIKATFNSYGRPGNFNKTISVQSGKGDAIILTLKGSVVQ